MTVENEVCRLSQSFGFPLELVACPLVIEPGEQPRCENTDEDADGAPAIAAEVDAGKNTAGEFIGSATDANGADKSRLSAQSLPPLKSTVTPDPTPAQPPFWGRKIVSDFSLPEVFSYINQDSLIRGQFRVRQGDMSSSDYQAMLEAKVYPLLSDLKQRCEHEHLLIPKAVYGYFPCQAQGNDLVVYHPPHHVLSSDVLKMPASEFKEWVRFSFPRQNFGKNLCIDRKSVV